MKNKKSTYILLVAVLVIWGLLIYRFFSFSGAEHPDNVPVNFSLKPLDVKPRDSIIIDIDYRDPFLGKMYSPQSKSISKKNVLKTSKPKEVIVWPAIIYKGIVSDTKDKKKVFMVIINGQTYLMHQKDNESDIILLSGNRDYIEITYKGQKNKITIQP